MVAVAEPALPTAVLNQSERKRRRTAYNPLSIHIWIIAQERVGTDMIRIFMHTTGSQQGSRGESRIRQRTVDTQGLNHFMFSGSMFWILDMWILASLCPTIGSQSGQSPMWKQTNLLHMAHSVKLGEILNHFKIIKPNSNKHNKYRKSSQIKGYSGQFMSISIPFRTLASIHNKFNNFDAIWPFPTKTSVIY